MGKRGVKVKQFLDSSKALSYTFCGCGIWYIIFKSFVVKEPITSFLEVWNVWSKMLMLSIIHFTISVYGKIFSVAIILCRKEHAASKYEASEEVVASAVSLVSIILETLFSSRLYISSQEEVSLSLVCVVSENNVGISVTSDVENWVSSLDIFPFLNLVIFLHNYLLVEILQYRA